MWAVAKRQACGRAGARRAGVWGDAQGPRGSVGTRLGGGAAVEAAGPRHVAVAEDDRASGRSLVEVEREERPVRGAVALMCLR